jgi:hypothetical protein
MSLSDVSLTAHNIQAIAYFLRHDQTISVLKLVRCGLTTTTFAPIARVLQESNLIELDLTGNPLSDPFGDYPLGGLQKVCLAECDLNREALDTLCRLCTGDSASNVLSEVVVGSKNSVDGQLRLEWEFFAKLLASAPIALSRFVFLTPDFGEEYFSRFAYKLVHTPTLCVFELPNVAAALRPPLKRRATLVKLCRAQNHLGLSVKVLRHFKTKHKNTESI